MVSFTMGHFLTFSAIFPTLRVGSQKDVNSTDLLRETYLTELAFKRDFETQPLRIAEGTQNFKELIQHSTVFVDKTVLVNELLNDTEMTRFVTLNYPQNWGKSVNLHMLKTFLEIEVDKKGNRILPLNETRNYRLFKKGELVLDNGEVQKLNQSLLIADDEFSMNEYLGKRPVIFFNLTNFNPGTCFDDLYAELAGRISDSFAEHDYMKEVFNEIIDDKSKSESQIKEAQQNLDMYEKILWKKTDDPIEMEKSLNFLSKILTEHFKKKVFILVDSYDAPFNNTFLCRALPTSHEQKFIDFYRKFNFYTFVSNPNLKRAFLTGVIPLAKGDLLRSMNNAKEISLMSNHTNIHRFYAFSKLDVDDLLKLFKFDKNLTTKAYQHYEGYAVGFPPKCIALEPTAIVHLLNTKQFKVTDSRFLMKYFEVDSIRLAFNSLLSGLQFPVDFTNITFDQADFKHLQKALYFNEKTYGPVIKTFLRYLFAGGYLSLTQSLVPGVTCTRFPTGEMYATLGESLVNYYGRKMLFPSRTIVPICNRFRDEFKIFVQSEKQTSANLTAILEEFFSHIFRPHGYIVNENEDTMRLVLDYLSIFIFAFKRYPTYGTEIMLLGKGLGVIIDSTFDKPLAVEALERAKNSLSKFPPLSFPRVKYIGINVRSNASVDLLATM